MAVELSAARHLRRARDHTVTIAPLWWAERLRNECRDHELVREAVGGFERLADEAADAGARPDAVRLSRSQLAGALREMTLVQGFAVVVAWGSVKGTLWVRRVGDALTDDPLVLEKLALIFDPQRQRGRYNAAWEPFAGLFGKLWRDDDWSKARIKGFGTAFGTKLLYWASVVHAPDAPRPLIYDANVHRALAGLDIGWRDPQTGSVNRFDHPWACVRFACYAGFCAFAAQSARLLDTEAGAADPFEADDIEYWLFTVGPTLPRSAIWSGCRGREEGAGAPTPEDEDRRADPVAVPVDSKAVLAALAERTGSVRGPPD